VDARLGQTTLVTEVLPVLEDTRVQRVRAGFPLVSGIRGAYEMRRAGGSRGSVPVSDLDGRCRRTDLMFTITREWW